MPQIRVSTQLVQIGVVVHDHNGPVADLTKADFVVLDRGKPQEISIFETETAASAVSSGAPLPQDTFSNLARYETNKPGSITIVLLDNLNTLYGTAAQPYETSPYWMEDLALTNAKGHLIKLVSELDPRDRVAIYGLSRSLHIVCDFTSDRSQLLTVLKKYDTTSVTNRGMVEPGAIHTPAPGTGFNGALNASEGTLAGMANANRAAVTMAALRSIAAHVVNIPGRKNLVWLTANLPFSTAAMASVLTPAQIAVYPVDGRGLLPSMSMETLEGVVGEDAGARGDYAPAQSPAPIGIDTMMELADDTGGQAAVNTNGLTDAIRRALDSSAATYTLGFYVDKDSLDGKFHQLKVQVKRPGLNIRYPKGYFAAKDSPGADDHGNAIAWAIRSPFEWSALPLRVRVDHVERPQAHSLQVVGSVGLESLRVAQDGNLWTAALEIYLVEQDLAGNVLREIPNHLHLRLTEQQYQDYLRSGIVFREYLQPKTDSTILRVLVEDPSTFNVGSAIIPLAQVK